MKTVQNAVGFLVGGIIALAIGVLVYLLINVWAGAVLALAAEILFTVPRSTLNGRIKRENADKDKAALKALQKEANASEKSVNGAYAVCGVLAAVSLAALIGMILFGSFIGAM